MSFIQNLTTLQPQPFFIVRVDFQESVIVTEHPVEIGTDVSDHAQRRPTRFIVDCIVGETAVQTSPAFATPAGVPLALQWLEAALGQPLRLSIDNEGVFSNLFIEAAVHARTVIRERRFTLRLKQVRFADALSQVITVDRTLNVGAPTPVNVGQQAPTPAVVPSSILSRTATSLGEIAGAFGF